MQNKIRAFTLMEVIMVMTVIGVVVTMLIMIFKPKLARNNAYKVRATLNTIEKVNENLLAERREQGNWGFSDNFSEYCNKFADSVATKSYNCTNGEIIFPSGVRMIGLNETRWIGNETGDPLNASGNAFYRVDFDFCTDDKNECLSNSYIENKDRFGIRILKNEPYVIPVGIGINNNYNDLLNENKLIRYKVISNGRRENGVYIQDYKVLAQNVSYGTAACITGVADEFLTSEEKGNITTCPSHDTTNCANYFDCKIQLMDIPTHVNMYAPRRI